MDVLSMTARLEELAQANDWVELAELLTRRDATLRGLLSVPPAADEVAERRRMVEAIATADSRLLQLCDKARADVAAQLQGLQLGQVNARRYARTAKLPTY